MNKNHQLKFVSLVLLYCFLFSCGQNTQVKTVVDDYQLLAQAMVNGDHQQAKSLIEKVRLLENTQNLLDLYLNLDVESTITAQQKIEYIKQFDSSLNADHRALLNKLAVWVGLKQIYQREISPPVRILQRDKMYLAPSGIDFDQCPADKQKCATEDRMKISNYISETELKQSLQKMALNDPCVNLSQILKGEEIANRCLKMRKGSLDIKLLQIPRLNYQQWLKIITAKG